jgi:hypothetical protein
MFQSKTGWQCYFVSGEKIVGCLTKNGLMSKTFSNISVSPQRKKMERLAKNLLFPPHPLDHYDNVTSSFVYHDPIEEDSNERV